MFSGDIRKKILIKKSTLLNCPKLCFAFDSIKIFSSVCWVEQFGPWASCTFMNIEYLYVIYEYLINNTKDLNMYHVQKKEVHETNHSCARIYFCQCLRTCVCTKIGMGQTLLFITCRYYLVYQFLWFSSLPYQSNMFN